MNIYNTYSKKTEEFVPLVKPEVKLYTCGPTVYGYATIGNFATFLMNDFLKRTLKYNDYTVTHIMNITDIGHLTSDADEGEDKIVKKAREENKTPEEIARYFEKQFMADFKKLNMDPAEAFPRATDHIKEMISLIEKLIESGHAYEKNGNVYFDISTYKEYGNLSGNKESMLKEEVRDEIVSDSNKKNPRDFVLWFKAPKDHLMQWDSPWSKGYPGWHVECSAMAEKYLGDEIDIHTGGEDNIFPHHECEIAQSECAYGKPFARYWMHRRHILVDGEKMSKSKGTVYTISDLEEKRFDPLLYRFFIFGTHYRSKAHFSFENLEKSKRGLQRITELIKKLQSITNDRGTNLEAMALLNKSENQFTEALNDDLNTPKALAVLYDLVRDVNSFIEQDKINKEEAEALLTLFRKFDLVLGVIFPYIEKSEKEIPNEIKNLAQEREEARKQKDFEKADELRREIQEKGFDVKDTKKGPGIFVL
ncbi:cysteine--tRNA ligase [Patescibacteria group bacterium]|nr:cysteine--tRNA ligase [Patescibacteria group bacterium]